MYFYPGTFYKNNVNITIQDFVITVIIFFRLLFLVVNILPINIASRFGAVLFRLFGRLSKRTVQYVDARKIDYLKQHAEVKDVVTLFDCEWEKMKEEDAIQAKAPREF